MADNCQWYLQLLSTVHFHFNCNLLTLLMLGLKAFLGILMKLLLLILLRNQFHQNLHLLPSVIKRGILQIRILVAGKDKETGRRTGERPMQERGSLHFSSSI